MWAYVKDKKLVTTSSGAQVLALASKTDGNSYPVSHLGAWSPAQLKKIGVYAVQLGAKPDPVYYSIGKTETKYDLTKNEVIETITPAPKPLATIYAALKPRLHAMRDERLSGGFEYTVGGKTLVIETDAWGRAALTGALAAANADVLPAGFRWRTRDNTDITLDAAKAKLLASAAMKYSYAVWAAAWAHKVQLKGYKTIKQFQEHDWDANWPGMAPPVPPE